MEARNFITAREMLEEGNWLLPTMNGEYRLAKPPFPTWVTAVTGLLVGDIYNISALRFPAGIMGLLMILSMFFLVKQFSSDKSLPFIASGVLCTSFYILFMARRGTWDIYCHSFMLAAILLITNGLKSNSQRSFLFAGLLMGLSFMSKGPVSFYVLLLPYLVAYILSYGLSEFKQNYKGLLSCLAICVLVSIWWPIYVYFQAPDHLLLTVSTETGSWQNRSVKPFWHYWSFPVQSGIWTLFIVICLIPAYARPRINSVAGNYKFLIVWVVLTILLLSLVPEKKERYLMPGLISQAFLVAYILRFFIEKVDLKQSKLDRILLISNQVILIIICLTCPLILYLFAFSKGWLPLLQSAGLSLVLFLMGGLMTIVVFKRKIFDWLVLTFLMMGVLSAWLPTIYKKYRESQPIETDMISSEELNSLRQMNWYSLGILRPEEIWEVGKKVQPINVQMLDSISRPSLIFLDKNHKRQINSDSKFIDSFNEIGTFRHHTNHETDWRVQVFIPPHK